MKKIAFYLFLPQAIFLGCDKNSGTEPTDAKIHKKLWVLPVQSDGIPLPSDSVAFSLMGNEIEKFRLWNGCFSFIGKDLIGDVFPKGALFDTVTSGSKDTLEMTYPNSTAPLRFPGLDYRCLNNDPIAVLKLEAGGFENKTYSDSDSVYFKFSYSIRPDATTHNFILVFYGQTDSPSSINYSFSHSLSILNGNFDTTVAVADISYALKASTKKYFKYGIFQFRTEKVSNMLCISGKNQIASLFE